MPKKVITRRQRKAAEAKRQSESNARTTSEMNCCNAAVTATNTLDAVKSSCNGLKPDSKSDGTKLVAANTTNTKTAPQQQLESEDVAEECPDAKTTVTIIVKDKTTQSDKNVFDLLVDENIQKQVGLGPECQMPPPPPPPNEQGSFSKSLTRRAVATFTKIQKLSKVFNKKMNYKTPPAKATEPINLATAQLDETMKTALNGPPGSDNKANKTCSCEFCKVVLNQLLAGKKRANEKKVCKNANRRLPPNPMRSISPGRTNGNDTVAIGLPVEAKFEEDSKTTQTPTIASRRRIIQMLEKKEKLLEKDVLKKIKQLNKQNTKIKATEQLIKKNEVKQYTARPSHRDITGPQTISPPMDAKKKPMPRLAVLQASSAAKQKASETVKTPKSFIKGKQTAKVDISNAIQQLATAPVDAPPAEVIGNTGYFILTGNDAQLTKQLNNLAARNVLVQNCVQLEPGVTDKFEQQLDLLGKHREQVLQRMRDKHDMMAKRRIRRSKEPSKYT